MVRVDRHVYSPELVIPPEVVLSQLIATFHFSLAKDKEIVWRFSGIVTPTISGYTDEKPRLPMIV